MDNRLLLVNGLPIDVSALSDVTTSMVGTSRDSTMLGDSGVDARFVTRKWDLTVVVCDDTDNYKVDAIIAILQGAGHFVDFSNGLESAGLLMPELTSLDMGKFNKAGGFDTSGSLKVLSSATTLRYKFAWPRDEGYTVIYRHKTGAGHETIGVVNDVAQSTTRRYRNGSPDPLAGTAPGSFAVVPYNPPQPENTGVTITPPGTLPAEIDDLVMIPAVLTDEIMMLATANGAPKWGPSPIIRVTGLLPDDEEVLAIGEVVSSDVEDIGGQGQTQRTITTLKVSLYEVDPSYLCPDILDGGSEPAPPPPPASEALPGDFGLSPFFFFDPERPGVTADKLPLDHGSQANGELPKIGAPSYLPTGGPGGKAGWKTSPGNAYGADGYGSFVNKPHTFFCVFKPSTIARQITLYGGGAAGGRYFADMGAYSGDTVFAAEFRASPSGFLARPEHAANKWMAMMIRAGAANSQIYTMVDGESSFTAGAAGAFIGGLTQYMLFGGTYMGQRPDGTDNPGAVFGIMGAVPNETQTSDILSYIRAKYPTTFP